MKSVLWSAVALAALAALSPASEADAKERRGASQSGAPAPAASATPAAEIENLIPYETFTLANGLRVVVHTDRKAPVVAVGVWYGVGSRDEAPGKTGFAHLFEHLMFNGTENYNDEWFGPFDKIGATDQNGTTWFDRTNYFQTVPTPALDLALWMESDRMGHLLGAIDQAKLDEQRGVVQNEKRQGDNQPYGLVEYAQLEGLFPAGHPYSWSTIGSMADLDAASLDDVKSWFREYYGAANAVVALVGDIDSAAAKPLMEKYFGHIDPGPPVTRAEALVPIRLANTKDVLRDRVPQARIYRTWATPGRTTREATLLDLAADVLGSGRASRLYQALVIDQQLATNVSASMQGFELASMFEVTMTLRDGVSLEQAEKALDAEIAKFLAEGPSAQDLERISTRNYASFVRGIERVGGFSGKATILAEGWLYADDPGFYRKQLAWAQSATPAEVRDLAKTWLSRGYHQVDVAPFGDAKAGPAVVDRSKGLPEVGATPDLTFPAIEQASLSNGAKLVLARRSGGQIVQIAAQFEGGFVADAGFKPGAAGFTHSMLVEGTKTRSSVQIAEDAEALGASLGSAASVEIGAVSVSALKDKLAPSLALFADVVRNPAFRDADIDRVRTLRLAQIRQEKAQPVGLALRLLPKAIYGDASPYGIPLTGSGTEEAVQALSAADLAAFHQAYVRPDNTTFYVVGDLTLEQAKAALEQAFAGWSATGEAAAPINPPAAPEAARTRLILIDKPGAQQSFILAGRATTSANAPDVLAQEVMNDALGGLFSARVNMNLREDKHWAYGAYTFFQNLRGPRPWLVYAPVQTDKTKESLLELQREIAEFVGKRPLSQEEFDKVIANSVRSLPGSFETSGSLLAAITSAAAAGRSLDWAATLTERYRNLTLAQAQAASKSIVRGDGLVWIVVGDRAKIEADLRGLGVAPLEIWDVNGAPVVSASAQ